MKAIILAAGRGSRMGALTDLKPKCMQEIAGKPLLHHAVEKFVAVGVSSFVVLTGYRADAICCPGVRIVHNPDWSSMNMLGTLFSAPAELKGDLIICYSDIVFAQSVAAAAVQAPGPITPIVDIAWRAAYAGRSDHPPSEAEKVAFGDRRSIARIGKRNVEESAAEGEFIGMIRMSAAGAEALLAHYELALRTYRTGPFQTAADLQSAYLTDLLQDMIDSGFAMRPATIEGGWREIDTEQDLKNAEAWVRSQ